jgi:hypothetical protein
MAVTTIATEELESLLELVATQDARIASLEAENDFLHRERVLLKEGPDALVKRFKGASPDEPCPPGYGRGNAGQLVLTDHAMIYARLKAQRRGEN